MAMNLRINLVLGTSLIAMLIAGCGGNNRQLQSLSVNPSSVTAQNGQAQFTATGQFNETPSPVTPVAVAWFQDSPVFDPPGDPIGYTTTSQPFTAHCVIPGVKTVSVTAFAPMNASAATDGNIPLQI